MQDMHMVVPNILYKIKKIYDGFTLKVIKFRKVCAKITNIKEELIVTIEQWSEVAHDK